jgi:hypothetical protein
LVKKKKKKYHTVWKVPKSKKKIEGTEAKWTLEEIMKACFSHNVTTYKNPIFLKFKSINTATIQVKSLTI